MYVIGLVGPFGSGCSFVSQLVCEQRPYSILSLSVILRDFISEEYGVKDSSREELQDYGDKIRCEKGPDYLASLAWEKIQRDAKLNYVVDSIRNPHEVEFFRKNCANFFMIGVFADRDVRWTRVADKYDNDKRKFESDDERDSGEKKDCGQRVTDTFKGADIILLNNETAYSGSEDERYLIQQINQSIDYIEKKIPFRPSAQETNMALAYALSMRSSCLKRKVGAVIVDDSGSVISSGYNEVPSSQKSCEQKYGGCYRDKLKDEYQSKVRNIIKDSTVSDEVIKEFNEKFKILDYCSALHAEENAMLNISKVGAGTLLHRATLYTSTYPCALCANKIAQMGIKEVVYFEPYPMEAAKNILNKEGVKQIPFKGVTYNGYFRLMEVIY